MATFEPRQRAHSRLLAAESARAREAVFDPCGEDSSQQAAKNLQLQVFRFITESPARVSFGCLKAHFLKTNQCDLKKLKQLVASLIQSGKLCYTSHFGNSFIEVSYDHPQTVSENVVIKSPLCSFSALPGQHVVSLGRGAAFGGGEHPTTRLAIQLIDALLHLPAWQDRWNSCRAIDIGTGSGVLAIVAAKMGIGRVCGLDIDPCAVFEACENVRLNQLETCVRILNSDLNGITGSYDMVFANLRMPTLFNLWSVMEQKITENSVLVFSGLKSEETQPICDFYKDAGFFILQKRSEKGWSAICLARGSFVDDGAVPIVWY